MSKQLTLGQFFKKKAPSKPSDDNAKDRSLDSPSSAGARSLPNLEKDCAYDPNTEATVREERDEEKKRRHAEFVRKFGELEEKREQKRRRLEEEGEYMLVDEEEEEQESSIALQLRESFSNKSTTSRSPKSDIGPGNKKWSPLELQVLDLKEKYPGVLLVIEVGYKFRFFGEDAKVASRVLHIAHFVDRNFYVASIPTHRLAVHVRRLVHAGYKVGVVRQMETAALKAAGTNRAGPFERKLTQLYTKGTFVDEMVTSELDGSTGASFSSNYLMCIVEEKRGGGGPDDHVQIGIVAVQPATGDIVYDTFEDRYMRTELETRLLHIEPCELLLPGVLSKATEKAVSHLSLQRSGAFGETVRIERMPEDDTLCTDYNHAFAYVSEFYTQRQQGENAEHDALFAEILKLPDTVIKALAAVIHYLSEFGLEHALRLTKYFTHFSSRSHMLLNANTMANLEIYRNSTNYSEQGSLFWILNRTSTSFGKRLFRKWVGRPLVDVEQLNERIDAVEELLKTDNPKKAHAQSLLKQLPDLEKGLSRIHYGRSSPAELVQILNALLRVANAFSGIEHESQFRFQSPLLNNIFDLLPTIRADVVRFREAIDLNVVDLPDSKIRLFKSEEKWPELPRQKKNIAFIEKELEEYLQETRRSVGIPTLQYVNVAGIEYLLEVKNTMIKKVPQQWIKISGTKAVSRFHTPFILEKLKAREQHRERLVIESEKAYKHFLGEVSEKYETFRDVVLRLAQLDCLLSLAAVASQPDYVKPRFSDHVKIKVVNGRHPMAEKFLGSSYVPNDIDFDASGYRTMILTGPNMGGKSSYIRQVALIAIMGQIGSYVPAESAELGILDAVYTRMGALDNMLAGESTFMVELHETSDIMKQATPRSLVILDELGRGTSTHDGMAIAYATLHYFITKVRSITLFVTHYPFLTELTEAFPDCAVNGHMSFLEEEEDSSNVIFLYKLAQGVAKKSYGLNVARLAGLPTIVLENAKTKAQQMEAAVIAKSRLKQQEKLAKCILNEEYLSQHWDEFYELLKSI